mmetsp:Transcript_4472/g.8983  ORF Transcript_4472/g.8983 Transcript_4472/m.8983 type:complete len:237 (+) Transcript_4472:1056-1766(+)
MPLLRCNARRRSTILHALVYVGPRGHKVLERCCAPILRRYKGGGGAIGRCFVHVTASSDQELEGGRLSRGGSAVHGGCSVRHDFVDIAPGVHQNLEGFDMPVLSGQQCWVRTIGHWFVGVATGRQQDLHACCVSVLRGHQRSRGSIRQTRVHVTAGLHKGLQRNGMPVERRLKRGRPPEQTDRRIVDSIPLPQQPLHVLRVPQFRCHHKRFGFRYRDELCKGKRASTAHTHSSQRV